MLNRSSQDMAQLLGNIIIRQEFGAQHPVVTVV
jgi:hypothetical protein